MKKLILIFLGFYLLTLIQTSFLIHFNFGWQLGVFLILIFVAFINFFESPSKKTGIYSALFAGFFLDIFSTTPLNFFGFWILIFLGVSLFIKFILRKYVRVPIIKTS